MATDESTTPEEPTKAAERGRAEAAESERLQALIIVTGPQAALTALIELLAGLASVTVQVGAELALPEGTEELLPRPLTAKERALIQHDLRGSPRRVIAAALEVTPDTVTVYRRLIRIKLRAVPPDRRPPWMQSWLRRFPGGKANRPPS